MRSSKLSKKEQFQKIVDNILNKVSKSKNKKSEIHVSMEETLDLLINLNQQIEEERKNIHELSKYLERLEGKIDLLIKELVTSGYIKISERRNLLKRNTLNQEALINLLARKKFINKTELLNTVKKMKASQSK